jgi:hypothetical protein
LQAVLLFSWADYSPVMYGDEALPTWADGLGWIMACSSIVCIPIVMVYKLCKEDEGDTLLEVSLSQIMYLF